MTDDASGDQSEEPCSNRGVRIKKSLDGHPYFSIPSEDLKVENIKLQLVEGESRRKSFRTAIPKFHSYKQTANYMGRQVNWLIMCQGNCLGVIGLGSPVMAMGPRDKYIGWDKTTRLKNLVKVADNWRYTLKPEAPKNAGSKVLSLMMKECRKVWKEKYGDNLVLLETLVEPPRKGTIYLANGWIKVGITKGHDFVWMKKEEAEQYVKDNPKATIYSKTTRFKHDDGKTYQVVTGNKKAQKLIFIKPLHRYWRKELMRVDKEKEEINTIKSLEDWL